MNNNLNEGQNLISNNNNNLNQNLISNDYSNDEELIKAFIGPNYEKITHNIFNFSGFFFSFLYMYYRKMFLYGILLFLFSTLINFFSKNFFPGIIINAILGLAFNQLYLYYVKNKITKIKNENPNLSNEELKNICASKGGTSIGKLFLGFILEIILVIIIFIVAIVFGLSNALGGIFGDIINTVKNTKNGIYDWAIIFSTKENITEDFSMSVPEIFEDHSNSYMYDYKYDNNAGVLTSCRFLFGKIDEFSDSENMIEQMANYYQTSPKPNEKINNIIWHNFSYTNELGTFYYYAMNKNNTTYLLDYSAYKDSGSDCEYYKDIILYSIESLN